MKRAHTAVSISVSFLIQFLNFPILPGRILIRPSDYTFEQAGPFPPGTAA